MGNRVWKTSVQNVERNRGVARWAASQKLDSIATMPESFGLAPEDEDHDETIRQAMCCFEPRDRGTLSVSIATLPSQELRI